jgi:hypothetical protein
LRATAVFAFGANFYGSMGVIPFGGKQVVGIASTPSGKGYWMVASGTVGWFG